MRHYYIVILYNDSMYSVLSSKVKQEYLNTDFFRIKKIPVWFSLAEYYLPWLVKTTNKRSADRQWWVCWFIHLNPHCLFTRLKVLTILPVVRRATAAITDIDHSGKSAFSLTGKFCVLFKDPDTLDNAVALSLDHNLSPWLWKTILESGLLLLVSCCNVCLVCGE